MSQKPELKLDWCSYEAAKYAVEKWHYSKAMPTPPIVKIGVWEDYEFIGSVLFSRGATNHLGDPYGLRNTEICELTRVALRQHQSTVSRIIAVALRLLMRSNPGLRVVISFADQNHGHVGSIYQASNWLYLGTTPASPLFRDKSGRQWHSRQVSRIGAKRQYGSLRPTPKISDCMRIAQLPKHRYAMPLDADMREQLKLLAKPYPKRAASIVPDAPPDQGGEDGRQPIAALQNSVES